MARGMSETLTIRRPDDWHVHLRDGDMLRHVVGHTARQFARAIVMPNLTPPVARAADAADVTPLMPCSLTAAPDADDLAAGHADGIFTAAKLYPAGATTNSANGVTDIGNIRDVLERMAEVGMPLCVHGEVTDPEIDVFDREAVFIERVLAPLLRDLPELKVVFEHATTEEA